MYHLAFGHICSHRIQLSLPFTTLQLPQLHTSETDYVTVQHGQKGWLERHGKGGRERTDGVSNRVTANKQFVPPSLFDVGIFLNSNFMLFLFFHPYFRAVIFDSDAITKNQLCLCTKSVWFLVQSVRYSAMINSKLWLQSLSPFLLVRVKMLTLACIRMPSFKSHMTFCPNGRKNMIKSNSYN